MLSVRDPVNCNHYMECPSYICSCDDECPCWKGCCKGNTPTLRENERHLLEPYLKKNKMSVTESSNCPRCNQPVGSMQVHNRSDCARYIDRQHKIQEASKTVLNKYAGAFKLLAENDKMANQSHNDEELARTYYEVATKFGVPNIPIASQRDGTTEFEDLPLRTVKLMAQFVRELRK